MSTHIDTESRSLADLIRDLRDESTALLRQEVALAKTEMTEKASKVGRNVGYLSVGGAIAFLGAIFLLLAISEGLRLAINDTDWAPHGDWVAPLLVGLTVAVIGAMLIGKAKHALQETSLVPDKTIETLKEDKQWAQAKVR